MALKPNFPTADRMLGERSALQFPVLRGVGHSIPEPPPNTEKGVKSDTQTVLGVREVHAERFAQYKHMFVLVASGLAAGAELLEGAPNINNGLAFYANMLIVDNPTGYMLLFPDIGRFVLANSMNQELRCVPAIQRVRCQVQSGTQAAAQLISVTATELYKSGQ